MTRKYFEIIARALGDALRGNVRPEDLNDTIMKFAEGISCSNPNFKMTVFVNAVKKAHGNVG
jgi:hypothetical protein